MTLTPPPPLLPLPPFFLSSFFSFQPLLPLRGSRTWKSGEGGQRERGGSDSPTLVTITSSFLPVTSPLSFFLSWRARAHRPAVLFLLLPLLSTKCRVRSLPSPYLSLSLSPQWGFVRNGFLVLVSLFALSLPSVFRVLRHSRFPVEGCILSEVASKATSSSGDTRARVCVCVVSASGCRRTPTAAALSFSPSPSRCSLA